MRTSTSSTTLLAYEREMLAAVPLKSQAEGRLPLVPVSPLFQLSREYNKIVAQTKVSLSSLKDSTNDEAEEVEQSKRSILERRLIKAVEKLDQLSDSIPSIQESILNDFNLYDVAKEIAYINCSLFRTLYLDPGTFQPARNNNNADSESTDGNNSLKSLLDFHRYLANSFAHQVVIEAHSVSLATASNTSKKRKYCIIAQLIHIAYILLHVYRDFSGCTAILTCLQMPEIQRLQSLWIACPSKLLLVYKEMVKLLSPENNYEFYYEQLKLHTLRFMIPDDDNNTNKSRMVAVPFIQAHLSVIQKLIQEHALVSSTVSKPSRPESSNNIIILSVAGQALVSSSLKILRFCQYQNLIDPSEFDKLLVHHVQNMTLATERKRRLSRQRSSFINGYSKRNSSSSINSRRISSFITTGGHLKLSVQVCFDLNLLRSNANIYHWLVSRAYLTKQQLNMESVHVQPLTLTEMLPSPHLCEEEEEEAYLWHWYLLTSSMKQQKQASIIAMSQHQEQTEREVEELGIIERTSADSDSKEEGASHAQHTDSITTTTAETDSFKQTIALSDCKEQSTRATSINETEMIDKVSAKSAHKSINLITFPASPNSFHEPTSDADVEVDDEEDEDSNDTVIIIAENDIDDWTGYSPNNNNSAMDGPRSSALPSEDKKSLNIETRVDQNSDEDEEEWTGYPLEASAQEDDDEDEIWRGYPIASDDEEEEAFTTVANANLTQEGDSMESSARSSMNTSSTKDGNAHNKGVTTKPTTPKTTSNGQSQDFEEWKGYQQMIMREQGGLCIENSEGQEAFSDMQLWNHTPAIGKAAARRMQHAFYNTNAMDRKRLPSSFMVSSSSTAT